MKKSIVSKNLPLITTGFVAFCLVSVAAYVHFSRVATKPAATVSVSPSTKSSSTTPNDTSSHPGAGAAGVAAAANDTATTAAAPSAASQTDPKYTTPTLAKPTGQLLNKSTISLNSTNPQNSPAMDSTCNSVAGATCEIHATLGSTTIVVAPAAMVDSATYGVDVPWNAKDKGLTSGTWTITAVAKKDGQSSTSESAHLTVTL